MTKKPVRALGLISAQVVPLTAAEAEFLAKLRTLCPDALRTLMPVFNAMYDYSKDKANKAAPALSIIQGGRP